MKKNRESDIGRNTDIIGKIWRTMKLLCCFLMLGLSTLYGRTFAQEKVTISMNNASLQEVFTKLGELTGYHFVYSSDLLRKTDRLTIDLQNEELEQVMKVCLKNTNLWYRLEDNIVVISPKFERPQEPQKKVTFSGNVTDKNGLPLPGVTILLKGTSLGVVTDVNGNFQLTVPEQDEIILVFSYVGMKTQDVSVKDATPLKVVMLEDVSQMEEVVVTGYSTRKISEMTGAVQQFKGTDIAAAAVSGNLMNALRGHTTGLQITGSDGTPGKDGDLLLRGLGTLYGVGGSNTEASPLIVIDGVITDYTSLSGIVAPTDVEEITILKDAASTAIYGSRAATGVIVVTTKKGNKDNMNVTFDLKTGISVPNFGKLRYMTTPELLEYGESTLRNWWLYNDNMQVKYPSCEQFVQDTLSILRQNFDLTQTTDWRDLAFQNGLITDVALGIRGGGENIRYYFSYNYYQEEGTKIGYDLRRHMFKVQMDFDVTRFLTLGVNMRGTIEKNVIPNSGDMEDYHPWLSPYDEDGGLKYNIPYWENYVISTKAKVNALLDNRYNDITDLTNNTLASFLGVLKPLKWLSIQSTNTLTLLNQNENAYQDCRTYSGNSPDNSESYGTLRVLDFRKWSFLTSNLLRIQNIWGKHNLNGLIGQEWYERHSRYSTIQMYDQVTPGERNVGGFAKQGSKTFPSTIPSGDEVESSSCSIFSEMNYNYAGRYMASISFRRDGSTNFGKDNRYGTFYAISASWLASEEKFMKNQKLFSNLKFRISYGTSGKEAGADYLNYTLYSTSSYGATAYNYYVSHPIYPAIYGATIDQLGNDKLSWETAHNFNLGIDFGFLKNRIRLSIDNYCRLNSNLIMAVTLPAAYGVGKQYQNVGEMLNRGVELMLNTHNIRLSNFNWYSQFTFSYNDNKLKKLQDNRLSWNGITLYEGDNIDILKLVRYVGVNSDNGLACFERIEEDGSTVIVNNVYEATSGNGDCSYGK